MRSYAVPWLYWFGTTILEIKNTVAVVFLIFLKHNGLCGRELWQVDSTSGQKQLTIFMIKLSLKPVSALQWKIILSNQINIPIGQKRFKGWKLLTILAKTSYFRCLTGFWIHLCCLCSFSVYQRSKMYLLAKEKRGTFVVAFFPN